MAEPYIESARDAIEAGMRADYWPASGAAADSALRSLTTAGFQLVLSGDMMTLVHFAHAWVVEHLDKVDDEEAELVERYMAAEHGGESDPDCSLGQKYRDAMTAPHVLTPEDEEKVHRLLLPDSNRLRETDD